MTKICFRSKSMLLFLPAFLGLTLLGQFSSARPTRPANPLGQTNLSGRSAPYCLAIRGNGELAPAHWSGMGRIVETLGLPVAQSGGSSATVSMFLLSAVAENKWARETAISERERNLRAAFLIKSAHAILDAHLSHPAWSRVSDALVRVKSDLRLRPDQGLLDLVQALLREDPRIIANLLRLYGPDLAEATSRLQDLGLIEVRTLTRLLELAERSATSATQDEKQRAYAQFEFHINELRFTVAEFGKFNAETDPTLFFRPGLISFSGLAKTLGVAAEFLSAHPSEAGYAAIAQACVQQSAGKSWIDLVRSAPSCHNGIKAAFLAFERDFYLTSTAQNGLSQLLTNQNSMSSGQIRTFPSTTVLHGPGAARAREIFQLYEQGDRASIALAQRFRPPAGSLSIGYWGPSARDVNLLRHRLRTKYPKDAKSSLFMNLGATSWLNVLTSSPAEPGLSPLVRMTAASGSDLGVNTDYYSAGGWGDLSPGLVLEASGCQRTVYLTRKGPDSLYAQGVAKRLIGLDDVDWSMISTKDEASKARSRARNAQGVPNARAGAWNRLYNVANPQSSLNASLKSYSAVLCSDWDRFDVFKNTAQVNGAVDDAYKAPWVFNSASTKRESVEPLQTAYQALGGQAVVTRPDDLDRQTRAHRWVGCNP